MNRKVELSRRKILGAMGTIGGAAALGGTGTMAFFSDEEEFANNQLAAGELDLKVSWEEHYVDWLGAEQDIDGVRMVDNTADLEEDEIGVPSYDDPMLAVPTAEIDAFMAATEEEIYPDQSTRDQLSELPPAVDPCGDGILADVPDDLDLGGQPRPLIDLSDVKPGDFGEVTFDFVLCDNPGWVWVNGGLIDEQENGTSEPENKDPDEEEGVVELTDEIEVTVWYDSGNNILEETETYVTDRSVTESGPISSAVALTGEQRIIAQGTLRDVLDKLSGGFGIPLDGIPNDETRQCFDPTPTIHNIGFLWKLPVDHANEIQTDSVSFDLGFYTEQCRHNDGAGITETFNLSTGHADWQVTETPDGNGLGPAQIVDAPGAWDTSTCADWVDPYGNGGLTSDPVGNYVYELSFDIPEEAENCTLSIPEYGADNEIELLLDGDTIASFGGERGFDPLKGPISVSDVGPGTHTLEANVVNRSGGSGNPTGLLVCATVVCPIQSG